MDRGLATALRVVALALTTLAAGCSDALPDLECIQAGDCPTGAWCVDSECQTPEDLLRCPDPRGGAVLGGPCGTCGNGRWTCSSDGWTCFGERVNACGGCENPPGELGGSCGVCDGAWACDGQQFVCLDERNVCGGCAALEPAGAALDQACERDTPDDLFDGVWSCIGPNRIACVTPSMNACGGTVPLDATPGDTCGPCGLGRWTCTDSDAVECCYGDAETCGVEAAPLDACGGCNGLPPVVGEPCGACGLGEWQLDCARGQLVCRDDTINPCGGCAALAVTPGSRCGDRGVWACAGPDAVVCANGVGAPCRADGAAGCGECGAGRVVCVAPEDSACVAAPSTTECGTCGALGAPVDSTCADGRWQCAEAPSAGEPPMVCAANTARDACGGTSGSATEPFDRCGECNGWWGCDGDALTCVLGPEQRPRTMYRDADGDGFGDSSDPGASLCGDADGYSERAGDCDDGEREVHPAATEVSGNDRDDDCDPNTLD